ncbi:unnamed protein product, partial [Rotaria magnacalcarata]
ISAHNSGDIDENINVANMTHRRRPELHIVDFVTDALPIDCVLVYSVLSLSMQYKSTTGKTEYVLVHTPFPVLLRVAEDMQMKLRIEVRR